MYENGYLLFKPETGKDTLSNNGSMSWKINYEKQIKAIGFDKEIYFPEYSANLFQRIPNLEHFDGHNVNTSLVKNIAGLFSYNFNLKKIMNISDWNTSNIENMEGLFFENKQLERLDLSNWNVSKVKKITFMFAGTDNIKEINVLNWDTSNIDFSKQHDVFTGAGVEELNLSKWIIKSPNNSYNSYFFNNMKNIKRIILPQNSIILLSKSMANNELDGYSLKWYKEGTDPFKDSYELYNLDKIWTHEMGGTWLRATNDFKIDFDSKTEEVIEPIIFRAVKKTDANRKAPLPIPKIKKSGYKFVGWIPHSASEDISNDEYIKTGKEISVSELGESETLLVAKWIKEEDNRSRSNIIRDVNGKDLTDEELLNYTNPEPNPTSTTDNGDLIYIVHKIITTYKGVDTLDKGKQVVEKDGKTDGNKVVRVGTKPTVEVETLSFPIRYKKDDSRDKGQENIIIKGKDGSKTTTTTYTVNDKTGEVVPNVEKPVVVEATETVIKVAAKDKVKIVNKDNGSVVKEIITYEVNPKTGEITESKREEVIKARTETSKGEPEVLETPKDFVGGVNSIDTPVVEELPELKVAIIKDKENNILDVIKLEEEPKEIKGYKNTGKTEIDKNGYKAYIYEKIEKTTTQEKENKVDNKEEVNKEDKKEAITKKEELPKTSASMLSTVGLLSIFGLRKNRKKDKK